MTRPHKGITAAGGVVWRWREGAPEVLLIHRPRYDDWTLPKGKPLPDEPELLTAVREVHEETGSDVAVQQRIGTARYLVGDARKKVTYWSMRHRGGAFEANDEVDEVAWLRVGRAHRTLTYNVDRAVLSDFSVAPVADSVLVLVRHARAGKRTDWRGEDRLRPLDDAGRRQAAALVAHLAAFGPTRIYSADRVRCEQTVAPLAAALGLKVRTEQAFSDEAYASDPELARTRLMSLAKPGKVSVVCSQGRAIPALIEHFGMRLRSPDTRKAGWWVLSVVDGDIVATDQYDPP